MAGSVTVGSLTVVTAFLAAACSGGTSPDRPDGPDRREVVFASNAEAGTVSVIDASSLEEVRRIDIVPDGLPTEEDDDPLRRLQAPATGALNAAAGENLAQDQDVSPDGRKLYVSRGHVGDVAAFEIRSGELLWRASIPGFRADHMTISPEGDFLYVSDIFENHVRVIDTDNGEIAGNVPTGMWPHDNQVTADGGRIVNQSIGLISKSAEDLRQAVFGDAGVEFESPVPVEFDELPGITAESVQPADDPDARGPNDYVQLLTIFQAQPPFEVLDVIRFDLGGDDTPDEYARGIRPSAMTADGRFLYAQLSDFTGVIEYDLESRELTRSVDLTGSGGGPARVPLTDDRYLDVFRAPHHGLALSGDERYVCTAGRVDNQAFLVERETMTEVAAIDTGEGPGWATAGPDGQSCFIANEGSNDVSVISFAQQEEIARVPVGEGVKHLAAARVPEGVICPDGDDSPGGTACRPGTTP